MKKALFYGILASFFFAFTFLLNRSMHLAGGYLLWSACLRYLFTFPILAAVLAISGKKQKTRPLSHTWAEITKAPGEWFLWSSVGFVLFYAPLTFGSTFGESWLAAATWQLTIVAGILLTPLWGKPIPIRNLSWSCLILAGVFLLQVPNMRQMKLETMALTLIPILIAAFSYPLGNRKVMSLVSSDISTLERVYAMTLCSLPVWIFLSIWAFITHGLPGRDQLIQSFFVALFSGTAATVLFFKATDMVKHNHKWLAVIEATQSGEVIFTLLGGILFLKDPVPSAIGLAGIAIIVAGMTGNSLCQ